jgi:hypothetical protein
MNDMTDQTLLLDELAEITAAYANEEVTPEQERRGQELVNLADAAPAMLEALELCVDGAVRPRPARRRHPVDFSPSCRPRCHCPSDAA